MRFFILDSMKQTYMDLLIFHSDQDCWEQAGMGPISIRAQDAYSNHPSLHQLWRQHCVQQHSWKPVTSGGRRKSCFAFLHSHPCPLLLTTWEAFANTLSAFSLRMTVKKETLCTLASRSGQQSHFKAVLIQSPLGILRPEEQALECRQSC